MGTPLGSSMFTVQVLSNRTRTHAHSEPRTRNSSIFASVNYLAHFYLSGNDTGLLLGNFIADSVKGKKYIEYPLEVQRGILMHRFIDHFTDNHPVVEQSKIRLRPEFHHYSPVIVDVFYDHFLAAEWKNYFHVTIEIYAKAIYNLLDKHEGMIPGRSKFTLKFMKQDDWLSSYATLEGIHEVLVGMSRRTPFESRMEHASLALRRDYSQYKREFEAFFPELQAACKRFIEEHS